MQTRILCISLLILGALAATLQPSAARSNETRRASATVLNAFAQQSKLTASDGEAEDYFGFSVAISDDGDTAAVGVYADDIGSNINQGAVYVFVRSGGAWSFQQKLTASDGRYVDEFGYAVALSGDGGMLVVGARRADVASADDDRGAAYVFVRSGSTWSEWQKLTATGGLDYDYLGSAVAMSSDGSTIAVGADFHNVGASGDQGAVFVFYRGPLSLFWSQQQELTASGGQAGDHFGYSVALGSDGATLIGGANKARIGSDVQRGTAYVFVCSGGVWSQQQQLLASDGAALDQFGNAVALSGGGNTAVVGAYQDSTDYTSAHGSAYVFTRSGGTWSQQQKLTASDGAADDQFGFAVALSRDGSTLAIGARYADLTVIDDDRGAAYVFAPSGGTWSEQQKLTDADTGYYDHFGNAVAVSQNGGTIVVGVDSDNVGSTSDQGSVVMFAMQYRLYLPLILKGN